MSFQREIKYPGADPVIVFWYLAEDLFNDTNLLSLYRSKSIIAQGGDNTGDAMIDEYAITEDERDAFYIFARKALYDVFAQVVKMTKALEDTVFVNDGVWTGEDSTSGIVTVDPSYGFMIFDNEAYNTNVLQLVDKEVLDFLRYEILFDWWELKGVDSEAAKYKLKWETSRRNLVNKYLFQLRKPLIR